MRDTFFCWFVVLVFFAIYFGAAVERARATGCIDSYGIGMPALIGVIAGAGLYSHHRAAVRRAASQGEAK